MSRFLEEEKKTFRMYVLMYVISIDWLKKQGDDNLQAWFLTTVFSGRK